MSATAAAEIDVLLAFGDDEHLMGQHHTEWIGIAPFLEEDLAFSSIGQDELGHAAMLYEQVLERRGIAVTDVAIDELAFRRADDEYRSCALVEYVTTDWAQALIRHWFYDTVEAQRWKLFEQSSSAPMRAIAASAQREEVYHQRHADALLDVLLTDAQARERLLHAFEVLAPMMPSLLTPSGGEAAAVASAFVAGSLADLVPTVNDAITKRFDGAAPLLSPDASSSRLTRSADYTPLMLRMREVLDYDPQATW